MNHLIFVDLGPDSRIEITKAAMATVVTINLTRVTSTLPNAGEFSNNPDVILF